jgi:hypothetical protein
LFGKLLVAAGERTYLAKHGTDRSIVCIVLVPVSDEEASSWGAELKTPVTRIAMGRLKLMPLPLDPSAALGTIDKSLYDPASGWTATVAVCRFK